MEHAAHKRARQEDSGDVAAQLRALAFACLDFEAAAPDALLDAWFAASRAQRAEWAEGGGLAARHLGGKLAGVARDAHEVALNSANQGNLRCLRWARYLDRSVCRLAAEYGHLACLAYAHEHGCEWGAGVCLYAAMHGRLACLAYAHEHGCTWGTNTCVSAARNGRLACLAYAHEHGAPWDSRTCAFAAQNGHLACLAYAHEHGAPWDSRTCAYAAQNGHLDCLTYAHEHGLRGGLAPP